LAKTACGSRPANKPSRVSFLIAICALHRRHYGPAHKIPDSPRRENRYLTRQLCWMLTIQGLETYLLVPRDPADIDLLVEAIRPVPTPDDIDVVIGLRGPVAPPQQCATA
jgi:hypothetical protein